MKKVKLFVVALIVAFAIAIFAACDPTSHSSEGNEDGGDDAVCEAMSKEEIEHIIAYCATYAQEKGRYAAFQCEYYSANWLETVGNPGGTIEFPGGCADITIFLSDETGAEVIVFDDNETAEIYAERARQSFIKEVDILVDGNHVYLGSTSFEHDTAAEHREFYLEKVLKATLPSSFSKQRLDFIIASIATGKDGMAMHFGIVNEIEDEYSQKIETYEAFYCLSSGTVSGDHSDPLTKDYEYAYWSDGYDDVNGLLEIFSWTEHFDEVRQNGNMENKYIDDKREQGYTFYFYENPVEHRYS